METEAACKGADCPAVGEMLTQDGSRWKATGTSLEVTSWKVPTAPGGTVSNHLLRAEEIPRGAISIMINGVLKNTIVED